LEVNRYSPKKRLVLGLVDDGEEAGASLHLLDAADGHEVAFLGTHPGALQALGFSPEGDRLVSSGRVVRIWDVETDRQLAAFDAIEGPVSFSKDGRRLVRREGRPGVWAADDGTELTQPAERLRAYPSGRTIEEQDGRGAWLIDVRTGEPVAELPLPVACNAFSSDGRRLAVGSGRRVLVLDSEETGEGMNQPEMLSLPKPTTP
jgi:WD40 repeat protein